MTDESNAEEKPKNGKESRSAAVVAADYELRALRAKHAEKRSALKALKRIERDLLEQADACKGVSEQYEAALAGIRNLHAVLQESIPEAAR